MRLTEAFCIQSRESSHLLLAEIAVKVVLQKLEIAIPHQATVADVVFDALGTLLPDSHHGSYFKHLSSHLLVFVGPFLGRILVPRAGNQMVIIFTVGYPEF